MPAPKFEYVAPPDITEFEMPRLDRLALTSLVQESANLGFQEREIKKLREPITKKIKEYIGKYNLSRFLANGWLVNNYPSTRETLDKTLLASNMMAAGLKMNKINEILAASTVTKVSFSLKISQPADGEEE